MQLTIPTPCDQQFEKMTPSDNGRHCASCQKTVIDFTSFSDADLIAFFRRNQSGACGRLTERQLQTTINTTTVRRSRISMAKYVMGFGLSLFTPSKQMHAGIMDILPTQMPFFMPSSIDTLVAPGTIAGRIFDRDSNGIPGVVVIKGTTIGTSADSDGQFVLNIPEPIQHTNYLLEISAIGFFSQTIIKPTSGKAINISMVQESQELMGEVIYVGTVWTKQTRWQKIKNWIRFR